MEKGKANFARGLVKFLIRKGIKVVVVVFKDIIIAGNNLEKPWPESFINFAIVMHEQGLPLYIESSGFEGLARKQRSFPAEFFE